METVASVLKTTTRVTRKRNTKSNIATQPKVSQDPPSADGSCPASPSPSNSHPVTVFVMSVNALFSWFVRKVGKTGIEFYIVSDIHHPLQETGAKRRRGRNMQKQQAALAETVSG